MSGGITVREFTPADYDRYVELTNRSYPDYGWTVKEVRHDDEGWDHSRWFKAPLVAESGGRVIGSAEAAHSRGRFHPDNYQVDVTVDPDERRRGAGGALYARLEAALRERNAHLARGATKESMADGVRFLEAHGYQELRRDWESRLDVQAFDETPFLGAYARIIEQGIRLTTLAVELARDRDAALRSAYDLREECRADVPSPDPATPADFGLFLKELEGPTALPDAYIVAIGPDGRWLGQSDLWASLADPSFLWQGLTGVRREARGKGIAMALKLEGVRYAKAHGKREIKTWNAQVNRPMLRINEAMGFVKQPAWVQFEKDLRAGT